MEAVTSGRGRMGRPLYGGANKWRAGRVAGGNPEIGRVAKGALGAKWASNVPVEEASMIDPQL